jgi:acetyl-CoA carboxylase carboxyl transferase subunit beta
MPIKLPSFRPRRDAYPPDLWTKCPSCEEMLFNKQLDKVQRVCPNCGHHFRLSADARIGLLVDHGTFVERDAGLQSVDPLSFVDQKAYPDRVAAAQLATGMRDAAAWGTATLDGRPVALCVMDFGFMGGSMGAVVGEKVTRAAEYALVQRMPLIVVSASGGARMQEGTLALMQLVKTVGALERLRAAGVPYISMLSDPTTGGVFASFAVLGDINLTEPNALIGFAGARVSAGTIAQELPVGFQRSEFLFEHGFIDRVVHRSQLRAEIAMLLGYLVPASRTNGSNGDVEPLGLPSFRPLSFLTTLAERVMPSDPEPPVPASTNGPRAYGRAIAPVEAPVHSPAAPTVAVDTPPATEPSPESPPASPEPATAAVAPEAPTPAPEAASATPAPEVESATPEREAVAASPAPAPASDPSDGDEAPAPADADEGGRHG